MFSPETQSLSPLLLEYLWRGLRLPRRAIRFLLYLYSSQELETLLRASPQKVLNEIPARWKSEVPSVPPCLGDSPPPDIFLTPGDGDYPDSLLELYEPPWVLYARGDPSLLKHPGPRIAVVGTRRASDYSKRITARLVADCKPYRPLIVSGMAWGIDGVAHHTALEEGMATVGILGTPLAQTFAPSRQKLLERMMDSALVLSELYPEATMGPWRFPERNRLLAAFSEAIVVVEAPIPSGALITAQEGLELGREIFVVPGPISPHFNPGGHRLIQEGAHLLTHAREIFEILGYAPKNNSVGDSKDPRGSLQELNGSGASSEKISDPLDAQIFQILREGPLHVDKMIAISQNPAPVILARLIELSLEGSVRQTGAGYFEISK